MISKKNWLQTIEYMNTVCGDQSYNAHDKNEF